jgi:hypothetical protein
MTPVTTTTATEQPFSNSKFSTTKINQLPISTNSTSSPLANNGTTNTTTASAAAATTAVTAIPINNNNSNNNNMTINSGSIVASTQNVQPNQNANSNNSIQINGFGKIKNIYVFCFVLI